ncbi:hypothetical protein E0M25_27350 [Bacillus mycoides]|uniref:hypothetical protein n=1 Tax=Bacillus cereus group TaxID=86661 RepID=UPI00103D4EC6|nr:hypothetical protein [Bacillus mycoides]QWH15410.1 hypothetical protein EXW38_29865 [Bacillus mycoides]TBX71390.1 hypothetical protein E0M25_27350 [Bacillus mycoides]
MQGEMKIFDEVFHGEIIKKFKEFIKPFNEISLDKWLIFSDYCFDDKQKLYNSAAFTIIPYIDHPDTLKQVMNLIAPKDLKKTKNIDAKFGEFIKSGYVFNLSLVFEKDEGHYFLKRTKDVYQADINSLIKGVQKWIENTPKQANYYKQTIKKMKILNQEMERRTFNLKLYQNTYIIQAIVTYLFYIISNESKVKPTSLGWFSDRDSVLTSNNGLIKDLININYHSLCEYKGISEKECPKLFFPDNASFNEKTLWYDELNRIPDYLAGALAGRNYVSPEKDKYDELFEEAIAENPYLGVINFDFENKEKRINSLTFQLAKKDEIKK